MVVKHYHGIQPCPDTVFIIGKDYMDCHAQLFDFIRKHPEKCGRHVCYYDMGLKCGKPIPLPEHVFEVHLLPECTGPIPGTHWPCDGGICLWTGCVDVERALHDRK